MALIPGMNADRVILVVFSLTAGLVGSLGNLLIVGAVVVEQKLHFLGSMFVVNLAIADLLVTSATLPTMSANLVHGGDVFEGGWGCYASGVVAVESCLASSASIAFIAMDRYFCVCHEVRHRRFFTFRNVCVMVAATWIYPAILFTPNYIFGVGDFIFQPTFDICTTTFPKGSLWFNLMVVGSTQVPIIICSVCYFKIARTVWISKRKIRMHQQDKTEVKQSDVDLYRTLFIIFILFLICWTPFGVFQMLMDTGTVTSLPDILQRMGCILALCNSVVNCFVYGYTNKHFKRGYVTLVTMMFGPLCRLTRPCWQQLARRCGRKYDENRVVVVKAVNVRPLEISTAVTDIY